VCVCVCDLMCVAYLYVYQDVDEKAVSAGVCLSICSTLHVITTL